MGPLRETERDFSIAIVDFGSQTAHLISRRLRQLGIPTCLVSPEDALDRISTQYPKGIILSGGPASVYEKGAPQVDGKIFDLGLPVLGICYGWQLMAQHFGGQVQGGSKEYGPQILTVDKKNSLFGLPEPKFTVYMSHGDTVTTLPPNFQSLATTETVANAAVEDPFRKLYGVQFHPEVNHTEYGLDILRNFAEKVCGGSIKPWNLNPDEIIDNLRQQVGNNKVIFAVSGGVDSTVAAFLVGKAIDGNLIPVHVESGLMRPQTEELVEYIFRDLIQADLSVVRAREKFLQTLKGVRDSERKRKRIGKLYIRLLEEAALKHPGVRFLGQGTIYSDVIESQGTKHSDKIKSHHNVGGLPKEMKLKLVEPLREYYKDEVRELGRLAGLPEEVIRQQPFPGPGYAVRIRGAVTEHRLMQVQIADQIVIEEMKRAGVYDQVLQCFAVMTGATSTAVKGDSRALAEVVAVRAYTSEDIMTSDVLDLPPDLRQRLSSRIVNEVPDVSRVVYDITTKPPATMEWE